MFKLFRRIAEGAGWCWAIAYGLQVLGLPALNLGPAFSQWGQAVKEKIPSVISKIEKPVNNKPKQSDK